MRDRSRAFPIRTVPIRIFYSHAGRDRRRACSKPSNVFHSDLLYRRTCFLAKEQRKSCASCFSSYGRYDVRDDVDTRAPVRRSVKRLAVWRCRRKSRRERGMLRGFDRRVKRTERDVQVLRLHRRLRDHRGVSTVKDAHLHARYRPGVVRQRQGASEKPERPAQET